jgi:hypothetical protein
VGTLPKMIPYLADLLYQNTQKNTTKLKTKKY